MGNDRSVQSGVEMIWGNVEFPMAITNDFGSNE